jgi:SAM-dependent methyltransferase
MKILNLGCGHNLEGLRIDIDPKVKPDIISDITRPLPIQDKFDIVKAIEVIEHVHYPKGLIENMLIHVKETGYCIITTPNALGYEISYRFRCKKKINNSVSQYLTPCVIKGLINRCGGKITYQNLGSIIWLKHIEIRFKKYDR